MGKRVALTARVKPAWKARLQGRMLNQAFIASWTKEFLESSGSSRGGRSEYENTTASLSPSLSNLQHPASIQPARMPFDSACKHTLSPRGP